MKHGFGFRWLSIVSSAAACILALTGWTPAPAASASVPAPPVPFREPNAVLIHLTQPDLNRILREGFRSSGGPLFRGTRERVSRHVSDVRYELDLSDPQLRLEKGGEASVHMQIRQADLEIGRWEGRVLRRRVSCIGAGVALDPGRPVDVELGLRLAIEGHGLHVVPEDVTLDAPPKRFRLIKPTRCKNNPLPEWLLWWLGKGKLRGQIRRLDEALLDGARRDAARLNGDEGMLFRHWRLDEEAGEDLYLYPQFLDSGREGLLVSLTGTGAPPRDDVPAEGEAEGEPGAPFTASRSYVGISESFVNEALGAMFRGLSGRARTPGGSMRKVLDSSSVYALIPGLRDVGARDDLRFRFEFRNAPQVEFDAIAMPSAERTEADDETTTATVPALAARAAVVNRPALTTAAAGNPPPGHAPTGDTRAVIRVLLSGIEMSVWDERPDDAVLLGTLEIESGRVAVIPWLSAAGGVSFEIVENEWRLASSGIEFDEELFAALLQEMIFGEVFETKYDPLAREAFVVGHAEFAPRYFERVGEYLVIGLSEPGPASPPAANGLAEARDRQPPTPAPRAASPESAPGDALTAAGPAPAGSGPAPAAENGPPIGCGCSKTNE